MHSKTEGVRLGAYAWLVSPTGKESVFLGLPAEDVGKSERVPSNPTSQGWSSLHTALLGIISGGVDPGEENDLRRTIQREGLEERGLPIEIARISNGLPVLRVEQQKIDKPGVVVFDAVGHQVQLSESELQYLQGICPTVIVAHLGLPDFLQKEGAQILRPYVYVVAQTLLSEGILLRENV